MSSGDLTTVAAIQAYLGGMSAPTAPVDPNGQIARLVRQQSRVVLDLLQRPSLISTVFQEFRDGRENRSVYLPNWPVTSVASVYCEGRLVPQAPLNNGAPYGDGWMLEPWDGCSAGSEQAVVLIGGRKFGRGSRNILINYTAGYLVQGESWVIQEPGANAAASQVTALQDLGNWRADNGVTYTSTGLPLVAVPATPAPGQYAVAGGVYTFNAADVGAAVSLAYSYTPSTLEEACISWIAERIKYMSRIGQRSQSIGDGQTVSFALGPIPDYVKLELQPYMRRLPIIS
jgi:hypothetical protein